MIKKKQWNINAELYSKSNGRYFWLMFEQEESLFIIFVVGLNSDILVCSKLI